MTINHGSEDKPRRTQETGKTVQGQSVTSLETSLLMAQETDGPRTIQETETTTLETVASVYRHFHGDYFSPETSMAMLIEEVGELYEAIAGLEIEAALSDLTLPPTDLHLQGGTLSPVGNYFPWRVPAGERAEFALLISPDTGGRVIVTLLEQGLEVNLGESGG